MQALDDRAAQRKHSRLVGCGARGLDRPLPCTAKGDEARDERDARHHQRHRREASEVDDQSAHDEREHCADHAEEHLPGNDAEPVVVSRSDLRQQRLKRTARERAEEVQRPQHREEIEDVRHALPGVGRRPEQHEEDREEGCRCEHVGDASAEPRPRAVAPVSDDRVVEGLDDPYQDERGTDRDHRPSPGGIAIISVTEVEEEEPEIAATT